MVSIIDADGEEISVYNFPRRSQRRLMHQVFHPTAAKKLRPYSLKATHGLLGRILNKQVCNIIDELR